MQVAGRISGFHSTFIVAAAFAIVAVTPAPVAAQSAGARESRARAIPQTTSRLASRIVNGTSAVADYPEVALILPFQGSGACSGTLIGCNTVLAAAACFPFNPDADDYYVF